MSSQGYKSQNRAIEGDEVVIRILSPQQWHPLAAAEASKQPRTPQQAPQQAHTMTQVNRLLVYTSDGTEHSSQFKKISKRISCSAGVAVQSNVVPAPGLKKELSAPGPGQPAAGVKGARVCRRRAAEHMQCTYCCNRTGTSLRPFLA